MVKEVGAMERKWVRVSVNCTPNGCDGVVAKFATLYEARHYANELAKRCGEPTTIIIS